ncbi:MAG TPA: hypothetical protein VGC92_05440, partial [Phenylobacterium sp.]
ADTLALVDSFFAFNPAFTGGVSVASGRENGADTFIVGAGAGGGPHVEVFDADSLTLLHSFFAFAPSFSGGVSVAGGSFDGVDSIIVGAGPGAAPHVNVFDASTLSLEAGYFAYASTFSGGVNVAGRFDAASGAPEPQGWAMLIVGFAALGGMARRRRAAA